MTLSSRHRIRNSSPGGLRPSTPPLGHGGSPQYWLSHVDGEETFFVSFKPPRPGTEPRTLAWKAAVLTTTTGPPPAGYNTRLHTKQNTKIDFIARCPFKESFSFKTRMPGTVKCRPTVAYWVQIDSINIATELITRYYLNGTLIQCCFNVRPTSATLAQHWTNIREMYNVWEQTQDIYAMSAQRLRRWSNIA